MQVSNHANERINQRCGLNKKSAERLSKLALENGISHHDTVGSLNRYLTKLFFYNKQANNIRIYGEYIYIFCDEVLVTVIPLDNKYKKIVRSLNKGE